MMKFAENDIIKALATVEDPDLKRDLVSLGMIRDLKVTDSEVAFTVVLTTPACPLKRKISTGLRGCGGEDCGRRAD